MFKVKDRVVCDYCQQKYLNELELAAHIYFHTDEQDTDRLLSSLSEYNDSYELPKAFKALPNGQLPLRLVEMQKEDALKPNRPMSDRIEDLIELCSKYPLNKPSETVEEADISDEPNNMDATTVVPDDNRQRLLMIRSFTDSPKSDTSCWNDFQKQTDTDCDD